MLHVLLCTDFTLIASPESCSQDAPLLQDSAVEQQLVTVGADPQQAKDTIAAFQAAAASSSQRHMLQVCTVDIVTAAQCIMSASGQHPMQLLAVHRSTEV